MTKGFDTQPTTVPATHGVAHEVEHARSPTSPRQADAIARGNGRWNLTTNHTIYLGEQHLTGAIPINYDAFKFVENDSDEPEKL